MKNNATQLWQREVITYEQSPVWLSTVKWMMLFSLTSPGSRASMSVQRCMQVATSCWIPWLMACNYKTKRLNHISEWHTNLSPSQGDASILIAVSHFFFCLPQSSAFSEHHFLGFLYKLHENKILRLLYVWSSTSPQAHQLGLVRKNSKQGPLHIHFGGIKVTRSRERQLVIDRFQALDKKYREVWGNHFVRICTLH